VLFRSDSTTSNSFISTFNIDKKRLNNSESQINKIELNANVTIATSMGQQVVKSHEILELVKSSNDSGCCSNSDSGDRYSTPSNSSLFDKKPAGKHFESSTTDIADISGSLRQAFISNERIDTLATSLSNLTDVKNYVKNRNLSISNIAECLDESTASSTSCSSIASSILSIDNSLFGESNDECSKKAQILCEQLQHILNISSSMATSSEQAEKQQSHASVTTSCYVTGGTKRNTLMLTSSLYDSTTDVSVAHKARISNKMKSNTLNNSKVKSHIMIEKQQVSVKNGDENDAAKEKNLSNRMASYIIKNGRKLFQRKKCDMAVSKQTNAKCGQSIDVANEAKVNRQVLNQIAAKLLSECIDLTHWPFTDTVV